MKNRTLTSAWQNPQRSREGRQAKILAVTSCPTGIAHTYMAAEGIEKAAKARGCFCQGGDKRFRRC